MHFLILFVQKSFLTKDYSFTAEMKLTTRGPLYTCLVLKKNNPVLYMIKCPFLSFLAFFQNGSNELSNFLHDCRGQ